MSEPEGVEGLLSDWAQSLAAANASDGTVALYARHVRYLVSWLCAEGLPTEPTEIGQNTLERYFAELLERPTRRNGREGEKVKPAYAAAQYRSVQQLWHWMEREGEITDNPFGRMKPPHAPEQPVPVLPDEAVTALLDTSKGTDFIQLRDRAIIRLFVDTGVRVAGLAGIDVDDYNWEHNTVRVVLKGGSEIVLPFGAKTSDAQRRYRRARAKHPQAARHSAFWLGDKGPLTTSGIRQMLERRAKDAGIDKLYPHLLRHLFAHSWLANGGQENDLMRLMGWRSRSMLGRYGASAADERAREAHRRAKLGDRF